LDVLVQLRIAPQNPKTPTIIEHYYFSIMNCGTAIICLVTCGLYPFAWNKIKVSIKFADMTLKR